MVATKARANYPLDNEGQPDEPDFVRVVDSAGNDAGLHAAQATATSPIAFSATASASYSTENGNTTPRPMPVYNYVANGNNLEWQQANWNTTSMITAAGATTNQTGADVINYSQRGAIVVLDMTNVGTGSVTITIQGKDNASGKYYTLLAGAAVTTNSTNVYTVYPGVAAAANVAASMPVPRTWRVITTANNANATTYTVGASLIS